MQWFVIIGGQPVKLPVEPVLRLIALGVSLVIAAATAGAMTGEWPTLALFWFAPPTSGGIVDPIFGKPLNFFLFALPAWQFITGWLLTLSVIACALAVFFILITGGARVLSWASQPLCHITLAGTIHYIGISVANPRDARLPGKVRATARRSYDFRRCDLYRRAYHAYRNARRLCGTCSGRGDRIRQRRRCATRAMAVGSDPSSRGLLCCRSRNRVVCQQLYRQAERIPFYHMLYFIIWVGETGRRTQP